MPRAQASEFPALSGLAARLTALFVLIAATDMALYAGNQTPTANAQGPYTLTLGGSIFVDGAPSNDPNFGGTLVSYAWDINDNGTFTDLSGPIPTLAWPSRDIQESFILPAAMAGRPFQVTACLSTGWEPSWSL